MKSQEEITQLLEKYKQGLCTLEELAILESWYNLKVTQNSEVKITDDLDMAKSLIWKELDKILPAIKIPFYQELYFRVGVAAAVIGMVLFTTFFYYTKEEKTSLTNIASQHDILPGTTGATLTLANGKKIVLSSASAGEIAKEEGVNIRKTDSGKLVYTLKKSTSSSNQSNILSTAIGQMYELILPDGSKVILNAASSLTYSTTLMERGVRRVKLEGEAYFQISKDKLHPFIVESKGQVVEVLGTHFNISAYPNEPTIKTTLIEGSIQIKTDYTHKILKPNQEAAYAEGLGIQISDVDVEYAIAWKNGKIIFNNESLESIMRKISRWYNVEVVFRDGVENLTYQGILSRSKNISSILNFLKDTGTIDYRIKGNKITITKK